MLLRTLFPVAALAMLPLAVSAQTITVGGGFHDAKNIVVKLPKDAVASDKFIATVNGTNYPVQKEQDGCYFILPKLAANQSVEVQLAEGTPTVAPVEFRFQENKGESVDLLLGDRAVLRYVNKPRTEADHYMTLKPFHQMFDPKDGKTLVSSGAHPNTKEYQFPHHRGLFFGFNKITYTQDDKKMEADIWHGTKNVFSQHDKMTATERGPLFAKHTSSISWHGPDGQTFAEELRSITVYQVPGGTLLDWSSDLTTKLPKVQLDGDPQHAGFHFRAHQDVAKLTAKKSYYLRPDGPGKEGETRNWDAKAKEIDKRTIDLPWNALSFMLNDKRYTVLRVAHPSNPKDTRGSERDYGRFGDYFEWTLTPMNPLRLNYRIWLQEGEMTLEQCQELAYGFQKAFTAKMK
jgi:hypothetical protein